MTSKTTNTKTKKPVPKSKTVAIYIVLIIAAAGLGLAVPRLLISTDATSTTPMRGQPQTNDPTELVEQAKSYIASADQAMAEFYRYLEQDGPMEQIMASMQQMSSYDQLAIDSMLAAELRGVDLRQVGLVDLLCDSLEAQYAALLTFTDRDPTEERDIINIRDRLEVGQSFAVASADVKSLLDSAMAW